MRACKCPNCGIIIKDDPMWKPLAWRIYWDYATQEDFIRRYPQLKELVQNSTKRKKNEVGNFYYHFEDEFFYYQLTSSKATRKLVRRFPKGYESMANRRLFEKTPSERGKTFLNVNQRMLLEVCRA